MVKSIKTQSERLKKSNIRRQYGKKAFKKSEGLANPFAQFDKWFTDILATNQLDPTAMVLSTVDEQGYPDSRVVLLKDIKAGEFIFYSHYDSIKGKQLERCPYAALNFYWPELSRQIRIKGRVEKISREASIDYFLTRPRRSQASAIVSPQSQPVEDENSLINALEALLERQENLVCPKTWGGYCVKPIQIEFWQGRDDRLHDRFLYTRENGSWCISRLAP